MNRNPSPQTGSIPFLRLAERFSTPGEAHFVANGQPFLGETAVYLPVLSGGKSMLLKVFCPRSLRKYAVPGEGESAFSLAPAHAALAPRWQGMRMRFDAEVLLYKKLGSQTALLPSFPLPGHDDARLIDLSGGQSLRSFTAGERPAALTHAYTLLCLRAAASLARAADAIHSLCLHLDITPDSVFLVPDGRGGLCARLLDLSAALPKTALAPAFYHLLPDFLPHLREGDGAAQSRAFCDRRLLRLIAPGRSTQSAVRLLEHEPLDERCDLFSIAAAACFMLTGRAVRTDCEVFRLHLPQEGPLKDPLLRETLETALSRALRLGGGDPQADGACLRFAGALDGAAAKIGARA